MARQGEAADVAAVVAWLDRIPLGSQPNYDAILRAFPGMQLDALVAIWEHRARDYSTRKAQALDRLMDVAVADFLGASPWSRYAGSTSCGLSRCSSSCCRRPGLIWPVGPTRTRSCYGRRPGRTPGVCCNSWQRGWHSSGSPTSIASPEFMRFQLEERKYSQ